MNVKELIDVLEGIEDKTLPIRILDTDMDDLENVWLNEVEVSDKGNSGYEVSGEVRLLGSE